MSYSAESVVGDDGKATVMVRLSLNRADELYWGLVSPKQTSRKLTPLIIALLKAYLTNETVRDVADDILDEEKPVNQIKHRFASLIELQAQASRYVGDLQNTFGSRTNQITNPLNAGVQDNNLLGNISSGTGVNQSSGGTYNAPAQNTVNTPPSTPDLTTVLLNLSSRLDKIEQALSTPSSVANSGVASSGVSSMASGVTSNVVSPTIQQTQQVTSFGAEPKETVTDDAVKNELFDFISSMNEDE